MSERTVRIDANGSGLHVQAVSGSGHTLQLDEPVKVGGTNKGANPLETVLAALAGCEHITAMAFANKKGLTVHDITFSVVGRYDPKGMSTRNDIRPYFQSVEMKVSVHLDEGDEEVKWLHEKTENSCPVVQLMKAADVKVEAVWEKA
ncbi:OsmC family protein [Bacillus fonticola]|uniref:OsmC family protein n=1 Tax=Bacillus fonticola TaxID=2728853 RepID=UPI0014731098|nr:OsmC family protein [Bacillus fonticola]